MTGESTKQYQKSEETDVSIVIPVFNEEGSIRDLQEALVRVLDSLKGTTWEIIFVNDGSTDGTTDQLDRIAAESCGHIGVIHLRRNFGKAAALSAGFARASGSVVITMDADLQDDPKEIPRFLEKINEGYDIVSGWKKERKDPLEKKLPSRLFNWILCKLSSVELHDFNCGFKAYRQEAIAEVEIYGEMHRFIPVLLHWRGFRVGEIAVTHHPRTAGKSKYGFERYAKGLLDMATVTLNTRFLSRPLHLFGAGGFILGGIGFLILLYLTFLRFSGETIGDRPLLLFGVLFVLFGGQLLAIGLIGEMINRGSHLGNERYSVRAEILPKTSGLENSDEVGS